MAATPPPPSFSATSNKYLKPSHSLLLSSKNINKIILRFNFTPKCEIRSFENHRNWTIEHVSNMNRDSILNNNNSSSLSPSSLVSASSSLSQLPMKNAKKVVLFYCAETQSLAEKIAADSDAIELRSISWGFVLFSYYFLFALFIFFFFCFSFYQCGDLFTFSINFICPILLIFSPLIELALFWLKVWNLVGNTHYSRVLPL